MNDISFTTGTLAVRARLHNAGCRSLFVTFVPWVTQPTLERQGYGEGYLAQQQIDAIHVISARNDWFQQPDIEEMISRVRSIAHRYDRIVTYGTSMGAYAAINFARLLGATRAIALMPQYSISSKELPGETRWRTEAAEIAFDYHHMTAPLEAGSKAYIVFDPLHRQDRAHAEKLGALPGCELVPMPLIGHNWIDPHILKQMVRMVVDNTDQDLPAVITRMYRERKKSLPSYYTEMIRARTSMPENKKISLLLRALELAPDRPSLHDELARILMSNKRFEEALYVLRTQATIRKDDASLQYRLSEAYDKLGDREASFAASSLAVKLDPQHAYYRHRLASAYLLRQEFEQALAEELNAVRLSPGNGDYHRQIGILRSRLGQLDLARESARRAVELSPQSAFAWHCLADVLTQSNMHDEARDAARKALALEPGNPYHHFFLARVLLKLGESASARPLAKQAFDMQPDNASYAALLASL